MILALVIIVFVVGLICIIFSSQIGKWIHDVNAEIKKGMSGSKMGNILYDKKWFSWASIESRLGPSFDVWLIRIIGSGFVGGSTFIIIWFYVLGK
jgi:hypothetical protein